MATLGGAFAIDTATGEITVADATQLDFETTPVFNLLVTVTDAGGLTDTGTITINLADVDEAPVANDDSFRIDEDSTLGAEGWQYRRQITFDNSGQAEALTDFPVLVELQDGRIDYSETQDQGQDLRFFDADGTLLAHEIEEWNEGGTSYVWVRVPQIDAASGTDHIWMYYGNDAVGDGQNPAGVWDSSYVGVWHLAEEQAGTGTAGVYRDSTPHDHDGTDHVSATGQSGQVAAGQEFSGSGDWVEVAHTDDLNLTGPMTISFWVNPSEDTTTFNRVVEKGLWGYQTSYYFGFGDGTNDLTFYLNDTEVFDTADNVISVDTWQQATVSYDSDGDATLFLNGMAIDSGSYTGPIAGNTERLAISHSTTEYDFAGFIDEVRISDTARSAEWIAAEHMAMSGSFTSFGSEEAISLSNGVLINDVDPEGDPLTAVLVDDVSNGTLVLNPDGSFSYTPDQDFTGIDTFTYRANDGTTDSNLATVTLTVDPVNDAPEVSDATFSLAEDSADDSVVGTVSASDVDAGDTLSYAITGGDPTGVFAIDSATGEITVADSSQLDFETNPVFNLTVTATDSGGLSGGAAVSVNLSNVNEAPTASDASFGLAENSANGTVVGSVAASDQDAGDTLSYSITAGNTSGAFAIDSATGEISVANSVALNFETSPSFSLTVEVQDDGTGTLSDSCTVTIDLIDVNEAPVGRDDPGNYAAHLLSLGPVSYWRFGEAGGSIATDESGAIDGTYHGSTLAQSGALAGDGNASAYFDGLDDYVEIPHIPAFETDQGTVQLWFNADDASAGGHLFSKDSMYFDTGGHLSIFLDSSERVIVRLQSTTADYFVQSAAGSVTDSSWHHVAFSFGPSGMSLYLDGQLADSDIYAGGLGASSGGAGNSEPIAIGASTQSSGNGSIIPLEDYFRGSIDEVAFFGEALSAEEIEALHGAALQDYTVDEGSTIAVSAASGVLANDSDPDGDLLNASLVAGPAHASGFTLNSDGSFAYTHDGSENFVDSFTYQVADGNGEVDTATATITINPINEAPSANDATFSLAENSTNGTGVGSASASDPDAGDTLSYAITGGDPTGAFTIDSATGEITVADSSQLDFETSPVFNLTVTVTDAWWPHRHGRGDRQSD